MSKIDMWTGNKIRKPLRTGIFLHIHTHDWREYGTTTWPSGNIEPVWRCTRCGDIMCSPAAKEN